MQYDDDFWHITCVVIGSPKYAPAVILIVIDSGLIIVVGIPIGEGIGLSDIVLNFDQKYLHIGAKEGYGE